MSRKEDKKTGNLDVLLGKENLSEEQVKLLFKKANNLYAKKAWKDAIQFYETINKNLNVLSAGEKLRYQLESVANLPVCHSKIGDFEYGQYFKESEED